MNMPHFSMNGKLKVETTSIQDLLLLEPQVFSDRRGWLSESFNALDFKNATGLTVNFAQDNHSFSTQWTLRGMHYQQQNVQSKLVRVIAGVVFDVVVDLRKTSPTFGKWAGIELSAQNHRQLWIPPGLAHGFLVLSTSSELLYKMTDYYHPQSEVCLSWDDPSLAIAWPLPEGVVPNVSSKDAAGLSWDAVPKF
jgi:dTDP-4-dehydrorhamnose 3,5-epimerase